jgi:hypothetical protein
LTVHYLPSQQNKENGWTFVEINGFMTGLWHAYHTYKQRDKLAGKALKLGCLELDIIQLSKTTISTELVINHIAALAYATFLSGDLSSFYELMTSLINNINGSRMSISIYLLLL